MAKKSLTQRKTRLSQESLSVPNDFGVGELTHILAQCLTHFSPKPSPKYQLQVSRENTGAVRGDAYTTFLRVTLPNNSYVTTSWTEDSVQEKVLFEVTARSQKSSAKIMAVLKKIIALREAPPKI